MQDVFDTLTQTEKKKDIFDTLPSSDVFDSVAPDKDYVAKVAESIKQSPRVELSPQEKARTGQIYAEPGVVTGGVKENDPFTGKTASETPLVSSESIKKALGAVGEIGATEPVNDPVQDKINQAIADRLSGMTNEKFVSTLPMYAIPGYAEVQGLEGISQSVPELKQGIQEGDPGKITGATLDSIISALMLGHRAIPKGGVSKELDTAKPETLTPQDVAIPSGQAKSLEEPQLSTEQAEPQRGTEYQLYPPASTGRTGWAVTIRGEVRPERFNTKFEADAFAKAQLAQPVPEAVQTPAEGGLSAEAQIQDNPQATGNRVEPVGISEARTEAELGEGSVEPGVGAELGSGLEYGRNYINKGGDPRLPIRRALTSGLVGKNEVGIVHAELERLRGERNRAADALEANPSDPIAKTRLDAADAAQRAWRKELQPVLTKASDALREAYAESAAKPDVGTYQGLADLMDQHFDGARDLTPLDRTKLQQAAKGVRDVRAETRKAVDRASAQVARRTRRIMSPDELKADLAEALKGEFADCVL